MSERLPPAVERVEFPQSVREAAWARCGGRCEGCGRSLEGIAYVYDHTIPFRRSRDSSLANCKILCSDSRESCNGRKTYGEDLPGIAAAKRYAKNRLPLDVGRPEKNPGKIPTRPNAKLQGPGFDKSKSRKFNGEVRNR